MTVLSRRDHHGKIHGIPRDLSREIVVREQGRYNFQLSIIRSSHISMCVTNRATACQGTKKETSLR